MLEFRGVLLNKETTTNPGDGKRHRQLSRNDSYLKFIRQAEEKNYFRARARRRHVESNTFATEEDVVRQSRDNLKQWGRIWFYFSPPEKPTLRVYNARIRLAVYIYVRNKDQAK